jgi:ribonuclease HI
MDVAIFTDGACSGNPGPGGWGAILRTISNGKTYEKELSGYAPDTTNNRMELTAVIKALEALKYPCDVTVTTDSRYVCDGISKGWARKWRANNWRKSDKSPALNTDLWESLLNLCDTHNVTFTWVKGHAEHPENTRCDELAVTAIKNSKL